jgi:hypothetical protein
MQRLRPSPQPVDKQQELLRTVYGVVTRRGARSVPALPRSALTPQRSRQPVQLRGG